MGEDAGLVAPVDLGLRSRDHLEPAVQPRQLSGRVTQFGRDPGAGFLQVHLDPLVVAGEPVLPGQPLVDDGALQQHLRAQPRVDHRGIRGDDLVPAARARAAPAAAGPSSSRYFLTVRQFSPVSRAISEMLAPASRSALNRRSSSHRSASSTNPPAPCP